MSGANFPPLSGGQPSIDMSKVPVSIQAGYLNQNGSQPKAAAAPKAPKKNATAQQKRCDLIQAVMLNQDPFGLKRAECLLTMSPGDIQAYDQHVRFWIQRGQNFSLKATRAN